ncbi:hypothetical protein EXN66_Car012280 [Channa argus]|uniref:Uncharacterized protein n=1 Tax=Channa argus TaxID=215402 RepID=A0A6G1Q271_CHAAH|nr:hypothetical protein EXN66_Car012280 [Channa argus]
MCLHLTLSSASSSLTLVTLVTNFMSSLTTSLYLLFGLPLDLLPGSSNLSILLLIYSVSPLNMSKPPQSGFSDFISNTSNMICPSDVLIPDPVHPHHSQSEPQHLKVCYLQLCLLSFLQCNCL